MSFLGTFVNLEGGGGGGRGDSKIIYSLYVHWSTVSSHFLT